MRKVTYLLSLRNIGFAIILFKMKMKKILLASFGFKGAYSPSLLYLKSYFSKHSKKTNIRIDIKDFKINPDLEEAFLLSPFQHSLFYVLQRGYDVVCFSCYIWNSEMIARVVKILRKLNPEIIIIVGGPEISEDKQDFAMKNMDADIFVFGFGLLKFVNLIEVIDDSNSILDVKKKLKSLVFEDCQDFSLDYTELERELSIIRKTHDTYYLETQRGCTNKCAFCSMPNQYKNLIFFDEERIKKELNIAKKLKFKQIFILDSMVNTNKKRLKKLCNIITSLHLPQQISLELRPELIDYEVIEQINKLKIKHIQVGLQSMNKKALENCNRHFNLKLFIKGIRLLEKNNINYHLDLICGLPGDTVFTFIDSIKQLFKLKVKGKIQTSYLNILPNSLFRIQKERFDLFFDDKPPYMILGSKTNIFQDIYEMRLIAKAFLKEYNFSNGNFRNK